MWFPPLGGQGHLKVKSLTNEAQSCELGPAGLLRFCTSRQTLAEALPCVSFLVMALFSQEGEVEGCPAKAMRGLLPSRDLNQQHPEQPMRGPFPSVHSTGHLGKLLCSKGLCQRDPTFLVLTTSLQKGKQGSAWTLL